MQPVLAPAPHPMRTTTHADNSDRALEEQLLGAVGQHHGLPAPHSSSSQVSGPPSSQNHHHHHNIDPAISGPGTMMATAEEDPTSPPSSDGRRAAKRELANTKRAEQNRKAQRAFRQRKEGHIKTLETRVREFGNLGESYKALQTENYQLRDYIISLQSRLLEYQGEVPQPPSNINLHQHHLQPPSSSAGNDPSSPATAVVAARGSNEPITPRVSSPTAAPAPSTNASTTNVDRAPNAPPMASSSSSSYPADELQASAAKAQAVAETRQTEEALRQQYDPSFLARPDDGPPGKESVKNET